MLQNSKPAYLTDVQAAEYLGLRPQTLRNWRQLNKGPAYTKFGRAIRYPLPDLDSYANQRKIVPEA